MRDVLWVHVPLEYVYAAIFPPVRLTRLAPAMSVCSLPLRDWLPLRAYALYPNAIGSRYGHMLSTLTRMAPATGICSLP
eukprot:1194825-Prorocentrum_minimum.AAC.3